jgi:hypothetical protein
LTTISVLIDSFEHSKDIPKVTSMKDWNEQVTNSEIELLIEMLGVEGNG